VEPTILQSLQNRRSFLRSAVAAAALVASPQILVARPRRALERVGMTTVVFRFRFASTRPQNYAGSEPLLTLLEVPEYFADRFGLHNVEFWSRHFESRSPAYLSDLKAAVEKSGSRLINIQVDETYNLADADEAKRAEGVALVKEWVDAARQLGAGSIRANPGTGDVAAAVRSLREINDYASPLGVPIRVENHDGISTSPEVLLTILDAIPSGNFGGVADFGNFESDQDRIRALQRLIPRSWLVSAKTQLFDEDWNHISFDFDRCVRTCEAAGYRGIYSAEQRDPSTEPRDFEKIADWMIEHITANI
jgi:sugar phosphate isomerase/epimerase